MRKKEQPTSASATDTAEQKPELDEAWFAEADAFVGERLVRRGRPRSDNPKQAVSLRLDREVVEWFRRDGEGWQTRMNQALRRAAGL